GAAGPAGARRRGLPRGLTAGRGPLLLLPTAWGVLPGDNLTQVRFRGPPRENPSRWSHLPGGHVAVWPCHMATSGHVARSSWQAGRLPYEASGPPHRPDSAEAHEIRQQWVSSPSASSARAPRG